MAEQKWPTHVFGYPQRTGYGYKDQENKDRTDVEAGPAQVRRRFSTVPSTFPVTFVWPGATLAVFDAWYRHKLLDGEAWFDGPLITGEGITEHTIRFKGGYEAKADPARPGRWIVSAEWETEQRAGLTEAELDDLIATYDYDAVTASVEFEEITDAVNNDLDDALSIF